MELVCQNLEELENVAKIVWDNLPSQSPVVLGLRGDLGSGKTAFVKKMLEVSGSHDNVTSPTFVIQKKYHLKNDFHNIKQIAHLDAYRLDSGEDLKKIGWLLLLKEEGTLILLEWPELVEGALPPTTKFIDFKFIDENTRQIKIPWLKKSTNEK